MFIDCPPSLGLLTVNALVAGGEVLIPIQCEYYALEGLGQLLSNIDLVRAHLNPTLHVSTILLTMYDGRTKLADQVTTEVRKHFGDTVLRTVIPRSVKVSEAPGFGQTVLAYDPGSRGAMSYLDAAREIAERGAAMTRLARTDGRRGDRAQGRPGPRAGRADPDGPAPATGRPRCRPARSADGSTAGPRRRAGAPVAAEPVNRIGRRRGLPRDPTWPRSGPTRSSPAASFDEDALAELEHSIREFGLLQPIVVREVEAGRATSWSWASAGGGPRSGPG